MLRIFDKQSTGKTKQLLIYAKENNCTVICLNPSRMKDKALRYELGPIDTISYDDFLLHYKEGSLETKDYVIDEPENLLSLLFINEAKLLGFDVTTSF